MKSNFILFFIILTAISSQSYAQNSEMSLLKGNAKDELGDYAGAIREYTEAIELQPDFAMAYFNRALSKRKIADYEGAIEDYTKAIEIVDFYTIAYHNRGIVYALLEKMDKACADWEKAYNLGYNDSKLLLDEYCY
ncbi:MAG: tetratricopeptide repeat protein [Bacteroidales bacterium]|nr:tetratricopeptide repeat protein [Bacteroidales bacterium]